MYSIAILVHHQMSETAVACLPAQGKVMEETEIINAKSGNSRNEAFLKFLRPYSILDWSLWKDIADEPCTETKL